MTTGYLYYDNSKDSLEKKVVKAVEYHVRRSGVAPDLCLVNREDYKKGEFLVTTKPYNIPKGHLWVGMEDE